MTSRFFFKQELNDLFEKDLIPKDLEDGHVIGVTQVCDYSLVIEEKKIEGLTESTLRANYANVNKELEKGKLWILELTADNISRLLLDTEFYMSHCDKRINPYDLTGRFCLYYDIDYSFWTENVYEEAFQK